MNGVYVGTFIKIQTSLLCQYRVNQYKHGPAFIALFSCDDTVANSENVYPWLFKTSSKKSPDSIKLHVSTPSSQFSWTLNFSLITKFLSYQRNMQHATSTCICHISLMFVHRLHAKARPTKLYILLVLVVFLVLHDLEPPSG